MTKLASGTGKVAMMKAPYRGTLSVADADADYGGECRMLDVSTGTTHGPFWVDLEFGKDHRTASKAVLEAPEWLGVEIAHSGGRVVLVLDDGREVLGYVLTVLQRKIILEVHRRAQQPRSRL